MSQNTMTTIYAGLDIAKLNHTYHYSFSTLVSSRPVCVHDLQTSIGVYKGSKCFTLSSGRGPG